jgi:hypothetical protein
MGDPAATLAEVGKKYGEPLSMMIWNDGGVA